MLTLGGDAFCEPLEIMLNQPLMSGYFLFDWKKAVSIHKIGVKQTLKNYRPVSLLQICGKVFEIQNFKFFS